MDSLSVIFIGLFLGAFIHPSLQSITEVKNWAEFEPKSKQGGVMLLLMDDSTTKSIGIMGDDWCVTYSTVKCYYAKEKLKDKTDTFYAHFNNQDVVALIFFMNGVQNAMLVGASADQIKAEFLKIK